MAAFAEIRRIAWLTFGEMLGLSLSDVLTGAGNTKVFRGDGTWNQVDTGQIAADAVTYAKMQNVSATDKVLGRSTSGSGDIEEIACTSSGRAMLSAATAAAQRTLLGIGTADTPSFAGMALTGGLRVPVATATNTYSATTADFIVLANATSGAFAVNLPAATNTGLMVYVLKTDASANAVTVTRAGSDTIEGATTQVLDARYEGTLLFPDGTATWYKLARGATAMLG